MSQSQQAQSSQQDTRKWSGMHTDVEQKFNANVFWTSAALPRGQQKWNRLAADIRTDFLFDVRSISANGLLTALFHVCSMSVPFLFHHSTLECCSPPTGMLQSPQLECCSPQKHLACSGGSCKNIFEKKRFFAMSGIWTRILAAFLGTLSTELCCLPYD